MNVFVFIAFSFSELTGENEGVPLIRQVLFATPAIGSAFRQGACDTLSA
jgi:hypothetical protein